MICMRPCSASAAPGHRYSNTIPVFALLVAAIWLREPLGAPKIAGAALAVAGVTLTRIGSRLFIARDMSTRARTTTGCGAALAALGVGGHPRGLLAGARLLPDQRRLRLARERA